MKLCKDCKHFKEASTCRVSGSTCGRPKHTIESTKGRDYVFGYYPYCHIEREAPLIIDFFSHSCGKRGRYWEAK